MNYQESVCPQPNDFSLPVAPASSAASDVYKRQVLLAQRASEKNFEVFNVATSDYLTVTEIAELAIEIAGLAPDQVRLEYTGGARGWKGDVPVVRLNTNRIRSLGWTCKRDTRQALCVALHALFADSRLGRI